MTKDQLIREISKQTSIDKTQVEIIVESFMRTVQEAVTQKESVTLRGFGSFDIKKRAAKMARLISKNQSIQLLAHYIPAFKPSKEFKRKLKKM